MLARLFSRLGNMFKEKDAGGFDVPQHVKEPLETYLNRPKTDIFYTDVDMSGFDEMIRQDAALAEKTIRRTRFLIENVYGLDAITTRIPDSYVESDKGLDEVRFNFVSKQLYEQHRLMTNINKMIFGTLHRITIDHIRYAVLSDEALNTFIEYLLQTIVERIENVDKSSQILDEDVLGNYDIAYRQQYRATHYFYQESLRLFKRTFTEDNALRPYRYFYIGDSDIRSTDLRDAVNQRAYKRNVFEGFSVYLNYINKDVIGGNFVKQFILLFFYHAIETRLIVPSARLRNIAMKYFNISRDAAERTFNTTSTRYEHLLVKNMQLRSLLELVTSLLESERIKNAFDCASFSHIPNETALLYSLILMPKRLCFRQENES